MKKSKETKFLLIGYSEKGPSIIHTRHCMSDMASSVLLPKIDRPFVTKKNTIFKSASCGVSSVIINDSFGEIKK